jgi:hypothetical protein
LKGNLDIFQDGSFGKCWDKLFPFSGQGHCEPIRQPAASPKAGKAARRKGRLDRINQPQTSKAKSLHKLGFTTF